MYKKFFIVTALMLALAAGPALFAVTQSQSAGDTQSATGRQGHHKGWMLQHMTRELNLTDAQQTQIKGILQAERAKTHPIREQLRQSRLSQNNSTTGAFDEAQARTMANKQAQLISDLMVERARTKSQIYAVLTPDQRQKAQQLMQQHRQRRQHQPQSPQSPS